jgi:hypothetical protein
VTPAQFVAAYAGPADRVAQSSGISRWTVLTQWALETGWCASNSGCSYNNLAGITCHGGCPCTSSGFCRYPDTFAFADDWVRVIHNGYYPGVLNSIGTTLRQQMTELGRSPWAASHYDNGGGPGSSLINVYTSALQPLGGPGLDAALSGPVAVPGSTPADGGTLAAALGLVGVGLVAIAYARRPTLFSDLRRQVHL